MMKFNKKTIKNKLFALIFFVIGYASKMISGDATAFVFILLFFVLPLLFAKHNYID